MHWLELNFQFNIPLPGFTEAAIDTIIFVTLSIWNLLWVKKQRSGIGFKINEYQKEDCNILSKSWGNGPSRV